MIFINDIYIPFKLFRNIIFAKLKYPTWRSQTENKPMKSEVIRVYTKLTIRVVPSCFLLHVVSEHDPFLIPIAC